MSGTDFKDEEALIRAKHKLGADQSVRTSVSDISTYFFLTHTQGIDPLPVYDLGALRLVFLSAVFCFFFFFFFFLVFFDV
jgi:hypothetical protein